MASLTSEELLAIVVISVLGVVAVGLLLYMIKRLRERRDRLLHELRDRPELLSDRAFNRIAMARREADIVGRTGQDISRARELIATAQASFDHRNFERAYESAQRAHESLVHSRAGAPLPSATSGGSGPNPSNAGPLPAAPATAPAPTGPVPPKNRTESQFQLRLLEQELATARASRPTAPETVEGALARDRAQVAFDRGDFTDAFRQALRARRTLGSTVEGLPLTPVPGPGPGASRGATLAPAPRDVEEVARQVAGSGRCGKCGYPLLPDDQFCRGCGASRSPSACPKCGTPRTAADTFCGRCGERFS